MNTRGVVVFLLLGGLALLLSACGTSPLSTADLSALKTQEILLPAEPTAPPVPSAQEVAEAWVKALNSLDIDAALSYLAEDATVSIIPPGQDGDGVYQGHAEIRKWYETLADAKGSSALSNCITDGEAITCWDTYKDEGLLAMGVDFIEGEWTARVKDGKIQAYTVSMTPDSLAKFPPAPEPTTEIPAAAAAEVRITTSTAMVGSFFGSNGEYQVLHKFQEDGTVLVSIAGIGLISRSRYWFKDNLLIVMDETGDCSGITASYEVYATYQGDQIVHFRLVLVGEDSCSDRQKTWAGKFLLPVKP